MALTPKLAIQYMRGHSTLEFLKKNVISIAGRTHGLIYIFNLYNEIAAPSDKCDVFRISNTTPPGRVSETFKAFNVPMINVDYIASTSSIAAWNLPNNGPDLMVTGQLTACSFAHNNDKSNLYCCHIQPSALQQGANKGIQLGTQLVNGGAFAGVGGSFVVFTHKEYHSCTSASVIGVRRLDGWSLYVQGVDGAHQDVIFAKKIL